MKPSTETNTSESAIPEIIKMELVSEPLEIGSCEPMQKVIIRSDGYMWFSRYVCEPTTPGIRVLGERLYRYITPETAKDIMAETYRVLTTFGGEGQDSGTWELTLFTKDARRVKLSGDLVFDDLSNYIRGKLTFSEDYLVTVALGPFDTEKMILFG